MELDFRSSYPIFALVLFLASLFPVQAAAASNHQLDVVNDVPKFEAFYARATKEALGEPARWNLWKKDYGLAAVPPGPAGMAMARKLLDAAWPRYASLVPMLPALSRIAQSEARALFAKDNAILKTRGLPIHTRIVFYVGQFDNNAFTVPPWKGHPATVMMPVEDINLKVYMAHELTHSINMQLAGVKNTFGGPVGETMFLEGLAMRTSQLAVPGLPERDYVATAEPRGWLPRCYANKAAILSGIKPDLAKSGSAVAMKYTFGNGNTGMDREVYCAAWITMGSMLRSGKTLDELARVPESEMVNTIKAALDKQLQSEE